MTTPLLPEFLGTLIPALALIATLGYLTWCFITGEWHD